jgi:hypothetical protein
MSRTGSLRRGDTDHAGLHDGGIWKHQDARLYGQAPGVLDACPMNCQWQRMLLDLFISPAEHVTNREI